jgi:hypothetical protein
MESDYLQEFVPKKVQNTWFVRFYSELMGDAPVGCRLSKGSLPNIGLEADNHEDCVLLCKEWNDWHKKEWDSKKRGTTSIYSRRKKAASLS